MKSSSRFRLTPGLKSFRSSEDGSFTILSLFFLVMILMIAGLGIDLMRTETNRARLQATLDRAVLAGASLEQTLDSEEVVRDYFRTAGLEQYLTSVTVTPGNNSNTVAATANMHTPSYFSQMLGIQSFPSPAVGQAQQAVTNIEISLVVDVSGSMGWRSRSSGNRKIEDLINAAQDFVFLMQCNPDDPDAVIPACTVAPNTVSISLVPYSEQVTVGETLLRQFNASSEHSGSSCVDFVDADFDIAAIPLDQRLQRSAQLDPWTNYSRRSTSSSYAYSSRRSCRAWSSREIVALSNNYIELQNRIGQLTASGNTSIDVGMKWGTALLDPAFQPATRNPTVGLNPMITPAFEARPLEYSNNSMQKVVVLMTDGENTHQHYVFPGFHSGPSPIYRNPTNNRLSAYHEANNQYWWPHIRSYRDEPYGGTAAVQLTYEQYWASYNGDAYEEAFPFLPKAFHFYNYGTKNNRLRAVCEVAKSKGIEIFTIGFETTGAANMVMRKCASSDAHHFDVDGLDLSNAFAAIAREIHELRLTN